MVGLLMLFFTSGAYSFNLPLLSTIKMPPALQMLLFPPIFLGFAFLVPMWPFHTWSPIGHVAAPTAVSMLHAGVLMKLGAYGIIRVVLTLLPDAARFWMPVVAVLATVNVLYGAMVAMAQRDLKFVVGYSSVSHMGYVLLGIASFTAMGLSGAVLQMFSHGIMTGLFFSLIGLVYGRTHTRMIDELGGLAHQMPVVAVGFFFAALSSLGLPGLASFVAELLVFFGSFKAFRLLAILSILAIVVTAAYILRAAQRVFMGPSQEKFNGLRDAHTVDLVPIFLLITVLLGVGIFPSVLVNLINTSVTPMLARIGGLF
jgi:NADH-quinone oxidoreductase subunit M